MLRHSALHTLRPRHLRRHPLLPSVLARLVPQTPFPAYSFRAPYFTRDEADDKAKKRLIVCCDGTWKNAAGTIVPPTNVARFARSIDRHGHTSDGDHTVPQLAYYAAGIGASSVLPVPIDYLYSGATGEGLEKNILAAYCFLCNNYNFRSCEDEIILVGFSRGAFTVRCLAAFIDEIGLIRRKYLSLLPNIFESWWRSKGRLDPKFRQAGLSLQVRIKALAEWDTVSSLWDARFDFVQGEVPSSVENAFLALAIDERRWSFRPMLWTSRGQPVIGWGHEEAAEEDDHVQETIVSSSGEEEEKPDPLFQNIKQCLFTGHHADIGGGNADAGLSTIALLWMISQIAEVSDTAFDRQAMLQTIIPLPVSPRSRANWMSGEWTSPRFQYESILMSKGHINDPPWLWALTHQLTFGLFSGERRQLFYDTMRRGQDLKDTFEVHFTVPLLAEGMAEEKHGANSLNSSERKFNLWKGVMLPLQVPNQDEGWLWQTWKKKADAWTWTPSCPGTKTKDVEQWEAVLKTFEMEAADGSDSDPVVHRVLKEAEKRGDDRYSHLYESDQAI